MHCQASAQGEVRRLYAIKLLLSLKLQLPWQKLVAQAGMVVADPDCFDSPNMLMTKILIFPAAVIVPSILTRQPVSAKASLV